MCISHRVKIFKLILGVIFVTNLLGCDLINGKGAEKVSEDSHISTNDTILAINSFDVEVDVGVGVEIVDSLEQVLIDAGLIDIQTINSSILIDLRYSSINNFLNEDVYDDLDKVYLQPSIAQDLSICQQKLQEIDSGLTLLVYDGVRPRSVQQKMWDVLDMPIREKVKFVSNPKNGSIHNYGAAVDLTISKLDGTPLDMGADFDDIRKIAYPRLESQFLASGELSQQQIDNRKLLRKVMTSGGFYNIQTEWWHFNRYNRNKAKEMFEIVE
jgi:D-alanyl-D-alanine dipeptidase